MCIVDFAYSRTFLPTVVILLSLCSPLLDAQELAHNPASFACDSTHFMLDDFERQPVIRSPNANNAVQLAKNNQFEVSVGDAVVAKFKLPDIESNVKVGWSPDSTQFFISYSDGGAVGGYHVYMYRVMGGTVRTSHLPAQVAEHFKAKHWCKSRGNNLSFLGWSPDSRIAFLVAEVYPTGDCGKELGRHRGYAIDTVKQVIVNVFDEKRTDAIEAQCRVSGTLSLPPAR